MVDVVDDTETCPVDADGEVVGDCDASSRDGCVEVQLDAGTEAEDANGDPLTYLDVSALRLRLRPRRRQLQPGVAGDTVLRPR